MSHRYRVDITRDVRIPVQQADVTLSADVYRPRSEGTVPALVMVLPYRKDTLTGVIHHRAFQWLAERGYACLLVDFRGTGSSDGVVRPPFDPGEADDAVAAIEWAAVQPWCSGKVGMWGLSYGALMTLRAASRRPQALRAIIPIEGMLDPELDFVHPGGARGGMSSLVSWGCSNLSAHLLPSLLDYHSPLEQRRWRRRLYDMEPFILDLARHGPGDRTWRDRVIDASAITAPALCVGGWRDLFCDGTVRAYEQTAGPKKLIMGPWMHTMPHESPFERVDFLSLALRWWDYWLRDVENGVMDEPAVQLYNQGAAPGWRAYESWPPAKNELVLATDGGTTLLPASDSSDGMPSAARYIPDPTTGALSGLWSVPTSVGLPLDQHEDDCRALSATSEPLGDDVLITGRPGVTLCFAADSTAAGREPVRIVVRLADVDRDGCSTLITSGLLVLDRPAETAQLTCWPTSYRVAAGHRLRLVVSDSDFPRLWPATAQRSWTLSRLEFRAPVEDTDTGTLVKMPSVPGDEPVAEVAPEARWEITRDPLHDGVEVRITGELAARTLGGRHHIEQRGVLRAAVRRESPEAAIIESDDAMVARLSTGEKVTVMACARLTNFGLWAHGKVAVDGHTVFDRVWEVEWPTP